MSDKIETNDLRGGLTHRVTLDPYRDKEARYQPTDFFGDPIEPVRHQARLSREFNYPPFSVLNARDGWWQERKREWLALGIQSELGRGELANDTSASAPARTNDAARMQASKKANAMPGGSMRPLDRMKAGKQEGQIKGGRKPNAAPGGGGGIHNGIQAIDEYRHGKRGKTNATPGGSPMPSMNYSKDHARGDGRGRPISGTSKEQPAVKEPPALTGLAAIRAAMRGKL